MVMHLVNRIAAGPVYWFLYSWSSTLERGAFGVCVPTQSVGTMSNAGWFGAARGTTNQTTCVPPTAIGTTPMKPTTTSVFASPVRPQPCRSRVVYGQRERAAGAQVPCFLPAQDGQAKTLTGSYCGSAVLSCCCRILFIFGLLSITSVWAGPDNPQQPKSSPSGSTGGGWSEGNPTQVHRFTLEQVEAMRQSCRDPNGDVGPAMVVIKPGHFQMGSDDSDGEHDSDETPKHAVTIPRPFAVSRCEITVGQFRKFVAETKYQTTAQRPAKQNSESGNEPANQPPATANQGCRTWSKDTKNWDYHPEMSWDNPGFSQSEQHPVVCVSHDDVTAYVKWLSQRTGAQYRLLSEAEWEYVARAETKTPRFFGDRAQCDFANGGDQSTKTIYPDWTLADCNDGFTNTAPVAQFQPNAFGLFDVLGNVVEWTADCWHENYSNNRSDGSQIWQEANQGDCKRRVVRGGSWFNKPDVLVSAFRGRFDSVEADYRLGFRIARAL